MAPRGNERETGRNCQRISAKGSEVYLEGKLRTRKWQDQSGQDRFTTEVIVGVGGTMQMLGGKQGGNEQSSPQRNNGKQQKQQSQQQGNHSEPPMDFDDDIPFAPVTLLPSSRYSRNLIRRKSCQRLCMVRMTRAAVPAIPYRRCWINSENYDLIMSLPQETKEEKEFRHCIWLAEKQERDRIYQTSIRPFRKATYTHFPEYIDQRLRNYRSRYGAISND